MHILLPATNKTWNTTTTTSYAYQLHTADTMESVPAEVLLEISKLACTDCGYTGCSLSRTSRRLRTISRSTRFQSVAISGTSKQLTAFLSCYKKERRISEESPHPYKPVVKHLFFAAASGGEAINDWVGERKTPAERAQAEQEYNDDLATLFSIVAGDLQTLCLVQPRGRSLRRDIELAAKSITPEKFPVLRELYSYGRNPFACAIPNTSFFPLLTHLRVTAFPARYGLKGEDLAAWAVHAPHVTHLCVSAIPWEISQDLEDIA
ncbi:hypothetical protein L227DRAFT_648440, partial [Lentinus tigrinus ALCF2SS1-6]